MTLELQLDRELFKERWPAVQSVIERQFQIAALPFAGTCFGFVGFYGNCRRVEAFARTTNRLAY